MLILDEPTTGLDILASSDMIDFVESRRSAGRCVLFSTHILSEAERLCDRIGVIRNGRLVAADRPALLRERFAHPCLEVVGQGLTADVLEAIGRLDGVRHIARRNGHVEIEFDGPIQAPPVVSLLVEQGVAVEEVRKRRVTLEDVFLKLMGETP